MKQQAGRHESGGDWKGATKVMDRYPEFAEQHPDIPWRSMRETRNRIAHGYPENNLDVVWDTVQTALPESFERLHALRKTMDDATND